MGADDVKTPTLDRVVALLKNSARPCALYATPLARDCLVADLIRLGRFQFEIDSGFRDNLVKALNGEWGWTLLGVRVLEHRQEHDLDLNIDLEEKT